MAEGHFEAKVERRSENAKGIFLTLLVNPADHDSALAQVRVGAALMIGWSEIVDSSVQQIEQASTTNGEMETAPKGALTAAPQSGEETAAPSKTRRAFSTLPLSQQCALRCGDKQFWRWLTGLGYPCNHAADAVAWVYSRMHIKSRSELDETRPDAIARWQAADNRFEDWLTTQQHGALAR